MFKYKIAYFYFIPWSSYKDLVLLLLVWNREFTTHNHW